MKKQHWLGLLMLGALLVAILAISRIAQREPTYDGRTLSFWLNEAVSPMQSREQFGFSSYEKAKAACFESRTNAVPILIKKLHAKDTRIGQLYWNLSAKLPSWAQTRLPQPVDPARIRALAARLLGELAPLAKEAIPHLVIALKDADSGLRADAAFALCSCGSEARMALPDLLVALSDTEIKVWMSVVHALGEIGPPAIPALLDAMNHTSERVRLDAFRILRGIAFRNIRQHGKAIVPALIARLEDPNEQLRRETAEALGRIGSDARTAIPKLAEALDSPSQPFREAAAAALKKIDREKPSQ